MKKYIELGLILGTLFFASNCKKDKVKLTPDIIWAELDAIVHGTLLSEKQLNASTNVAGTFKYTPPLGTKLDVGFDQILKVDFIPDNSTEHNETSKTVNINVVPSNPTGGESQALFATNISYGEMIDLDSNVYKTVTIGTQTWMAENLRTTRYRNGDPIPNILEKSIWDTLTTGACCNYNNTQDVDSITTLGKLYNRFAVDDPRNIAPVGWHVPTISEWEILISYLGGKDVAGGKLREAGNSHWSDNRLSEDNKYGFTALPTGCRWDGEYYSIGKIAYWFNSRTNDKSGYGGHMIGFSAYKITWFNYSDTYGYSVRCIQD